MTKLCCSTGLFWHNDGTFEHQAQAVMAAASLPHALRSGKNGACLRCDRAGAAAHLALRRGTSASAALGEGCGQLHAHHSESRLQCQRGCVAAGGARATFCSSHRQAGSRKQSEASAPCLGCKQGCQRGHDLQQAMTSLRSCSWRGLALASFSLQPCSSSAAGPSCLRAQSQAYQ